jgi:hypothetical protein
VTYTQRTRSTILAAVTTVALITAGCSNAPAETGSGGGATSATDRDKAVKFSECMRANGVGDFPDPNASGDYEYGVSVTPEVFQKAVDACKALQPPGSLSSKRNPEQQKQALKFAQCMREHGVKDFPDPIDGEPLVNTYRIPSSGTKGGMTILNAAMHTCGDLADKAAGQ